MEKQYIYYIENTVNEQGRREITGYFSTLQKAKETLKHCSDWYRSMNTGCIYRAELDSVGSSELVYKK